LGGTFKHVLPSKVKGGSALETDLSDKVGMEVLGYSDVGTYKAASSVAPKFQTTLGRVTRNATVKLRVSPNEEMSFKFWGGPLGEQRLTHLVKWWKGLTLREINQRPGQKGALWQDE
jgi:hypothetical protein